MTEPQDRPGDLGFTHRLRKNGEVEILHHGRLATTLRGARARAFAAAVATLDPEALQQRMARLTGNYKRGNESTARDHPRRRG